MAGATGNKALIDEGLVKGKITQQALEPFGDGTVIQQDGKVDDIAAFAGARVIPAVQPAVDFK